MPDNYSVTDVRASRTRATIVDAFTALALKQRYDAIRVSDLISRAGIGKSTFYEHFRSKDDVLLDAIQPVILALATAASGRAARSYVRAMVAHLWDRRSVVRPLMDPTPTSVVQRSLTDAIKPHVARAGFSESQSSILATGIAAAQLAIMRCWLAGQATATVDDMTDSLIAWSRLLQMDQK